MRRIACQSAGQHRARAGPRASLSCGYHAHGREGTDTRARQGEGRPHLYGNSLQDRHAGDYLTRHRLDGRRAPGEERAPPQRTSMTIFDNTDRRLVTCLTCRKLQDRYAGNCMHAREGLPRTPFPALAIRSSPHLYGLDALEAVRERRERHELDEGGAFPRPGVHAREAANLGHSRGACARRPRT